MIYENKTRFKTTTINMKLILTEYKFQLCPTSKSKKNSCLVSRMTSRMTHIFFISLTFPQVIGDKGSTKSQETLCFGDQQAYHCQKYGDFSHKVSLSSTAQWLDSAVRFKSDNTASYTSLKLEKALSYSS